MRPEPCTAAPMSIHGLFDGSTPMGAFRHSQKSIKRGLLKNILVLLTVLLCFPVSAQENLTASQWREDLRFLQNTVHEDYPFLFVKTTEEIFDAEVERLYRNIPDLE